MFLLHPTQIYSSTLAQEDMNELAKNAAIYGVNGQLLITDYNSYRAQLVDKESHMKPSTLNEHLDKWVLQF